MKPIIPARLKQARENAGLSLSQAEKLISSTNREYLNTVENSLDVKIGDVLLGKLSEIYGVSEAWLRGEEKLLVLPPDFVAFLERMSPDERDSLIDLLSSMRQNES